MILCCAVGDVKTTTHVVGEADLAGFQGKLVHPFYSTFALGRDAEWACRQFVLDMKEADEEGIGTYLDIAHRSPALLGERVHIQATLTALEGHAVHCTFQVLVGDRLIAEGKQGQKIIKKDKIQRLIDNLQHG